MITYFTLFFHCFFLYAFFRNPEKKFGITVRTELNRQKHLMHILR